MNTPITVISAIVVLAAGGLSQVYAQANNPPTASDFTVIDVDTTTFIDLTPHVSDPDQDDITITISRDPTQGIAFLAYPLSIGYGSDQDVHMRTAFGKDTLEYTVTDNSGATATGEITIVFRNDPPEAFTPVDPVVVVAGNPTEINVGGLVLDDSPGPSELQLAITVEPARGIAVITAGTTIKYTARADEFGSDVIGYTVTDFGGNTDTGSIPIQVSRPNIPNTPPTAANFRFYITQSERLVIDLDGECLVTDGEQPAGTLRVALERVPPQTQGTATVTRGDIVYTANDDAAGTDRIRYTVTDDYSETATGIIVINLTETPPNISPTAADFDVSVDAGSSVTVDLSENNCVSDPDGDALDITITGQPSKGTASIDGTIVTYTADVTATAGADTIAYNVSDGRGGAAAGTITINLKDAPPNTPPTATYFAVSVDAGASITVDLSENNRISDPDNDTLAITITGQPSKGTASIDGTIVTYTADAAATTGADTIAYDVSDGRGGTSTGIMTVNVAGAASANRNPTVPQIISVSHGGTNETAINLKAAVSDPDGDALTITITGQPSNGTATVRGSMIVYAPNEGATGIDRVNYEVSDGQGGTATGTIVITLGSGGDGATGGTGGTVGTGVTGGTVGTGGTGGTGGTTVGAGGPAGADGYTLEETGLTPQSDATLGDDEAPSDTVPSRVCAR